MERSMVSINTNYTALVALQSLTNTQKELAETTNRVNTGLKVASAADGRTTYAVAQNLRGRLSMQSAIRDGIDRMSAAIDTGLNAADNVYKILLAMRDKATSVGTGTFTLSQIAAFVREFGALREQIDPIVTAAEVNGLNLVSDSALSINVRVSDADPARTIGVTGQGLTVASLGLDAITVATITDALAAFSSINGAISTLNMSLASLGAKSKALSGIKEFSLKLSDTVEKGVGLLVDADLARESARLSALQTKQQLGVQGLSIANQMPQVLSQLFRGQNAR
jgi:flagellin